MTIPTRPSSPKVALRSSKVSVIQLAAGGPSIRRRRKYRRHEKRLTIKEKYEVGDYTLSKQFKAFSI